MTLISPGTLSHSAGDGPETLATQPFLFVVLNSDDLTGSSSRHALGHVDEVHFRRGVTRETMRVQHDGKRQLVLTFPDPWMSGMHAYLRRRGGDWFVEDAGSKNGIFVGGQRAQRAHLTAESVLEFGHTFVLFKAALPAPVETQPDVTIVPDAALPLQTLSPDLGRSYSMLADVAESAIPVLVRGETGTGKEVLARELHRASGRRGALVPVNCGAIPAALVEAELFGFRRGAFSGALEDRAGLVRAASGGTLFLDELGDLPLAAQPALLRVLQERAVVSIGSVAPVGVDFRLVSATHRDLDAMVAKGTFRDDLLARLSGLCVRLPPLRERREDLGLLTAQLLRPATSAPSITLDGARALFAHPFRQNVRELARRLGVATVLAKEGRIELHHVFGSDSQAAPPLPTSREAGDGRPRRTTPVPLTSEDLARRDQLLVLLREHGGNVTAVARAMGKARVQVQRWIRRYGLQRTAGADENDC